MRRLVDELQVHADVDKGNALGLQEFRNQLSDGRAIDAHEHEVEAGEVRDGVVVDELGVRDHAPAHTAVEVRVVLNLGALGAQVIQGGGPRRAKGVVLEELVTVEEVDLAHRAFGDQIEDVRAAATQADDRYF